MTLELTAAINTRAAKKHVLMVTQVLHLLSFRDRRLTTPPVRTALTMNSGPISASHLATAFQAMLVVDGVTGTVWPQASYWHMGHMSRFLLPGAVVLGTSCDDEANATLRCTAARNSDNTVAVVVQNAHAHAVSCSIKLSHRHVSVQFLAPPRSIHTVVFPAA